MTILKNNSNQLDPRSKIILVMCISTLAVFFQNIFWMIPLFIFTLLVSIFFKSNFFNLIWKFKKFIGIFVAMIFIQSIFVSGGEEILKIGNFTLISTLGIYNGVSIILRFLIIIVSASVMATSSSRDIVQGLYQWKIPYEITFMVAVAVRFLPMLKEEASDMFISLQLRGVELEKLSLRKKLNIYSYLLMPMIASVIGKAGELSLAVEMRGLRADYKRTSFKTLKLRFNDYIIMLLSVSFTFLILFFYFF
jgi:energy-coupling factor transport system permease protein